MTKSLNFIVGTAKWLVRVISMAAYKFYWDGCFSHASSLAYTTLFALVPVSALVFAIFGSSGFNIGEQDLRRMLEQFLPPSDNKLLLDLQQEVFSRLSSFAESVRALGNVSLAVLIFTGIALLNTIESTLNQVWRVTSNLSIISKIISFWAVITLGPLLIALSFYWYSRVSSHAVGLIYGSPAAQLLDLAIPVGAIWAALTLLFYKLPAAQVSMRDAALGAFIGAVLFELMKRGFAYYVGISSTYSAFYGALVSIPLFLFWLYLIWVVILYGAEISYQAGSIEILHGLRKYASELGEMGAILGLRILHLIGCHFVQGKAPPTETEIAIQTGSDPALVRTCMAILTEAGMITLVDPERHSRSLTLSPEKITVGQVVKAFRAKRYRIPETEGREEENLADFLETLRTASLNSGPDLRAMNWTLAKLVSASQT